MNRIRLFNNSYMSLFSDGTIGVSDGVGYVGDLDEREVVELYNALRRHFEGEELKDEG